MQLKRNVLVGIREKLIKYGIQLLIEHDECHDPYVDDSPTVRYMAEDLRESCEICKFIDVHRKAFNQLKKE